MPRPRPTRGRLGAAQGRQEEREDERWVKVVDEKVASVVKGKKRGFL